MTGYKQVSVTHMVPANTLPQVPPLSPTPSIVPFLSLYSIETVEPQQQRPLPVNIRTQPLVNISFFQ